jgi:hypothetical protein
MRIHHTFSSFLTSCLQPAATLVCCCPARTLITIVIVQVILTMPLRHTIHELPSCLAVNWSSLYGLYIGEQRCDADGMLRTFSFSRRLPPLRITVAPLLFLPAFCPAVLLKHLLCILVVSFTC